MGPVMGPQAPGPQRPDWKAIPHINQMAPRGKDSHYTNGAFNCAPAVVAMVARGWGHASHMNDAQLVRNLGHGIVDQNGTSVRGVGQMLERVNVPMAGPILGGRYDDAAVKEHLAKGNKLIAQVRSTDPDAKQGSAHYVLVRGQTRNGNYVISDPLAKGPYVVTPEQLKKAVNRAPPDGGVLIPVGRPGGSREPQAPVMGPMTLEAAMQAALQAQQPPQPPPPEEPAAKANKRAFRASKDVFEGQDLEFKGHHGKGSADMRKNEERNHFGMNVTFKRRAGGRGVERQLTPKHLTAEEYATRLLAHKARGSTTVDKRLERLESSTFPKDQEVLRFIKNADLADKGIGSRTRGTAFGGE
jgi:hypothetical protein